ncbi:MAG TPA: L-seryl-tRNA(Sec) selenium transferase [Tepidiformaceae bacterium]|nr:L-seryl-tRNA(Sec) selenium transferase [Tepidiformaceae bacterium]
MSESKPSTEPVTLRSLPSVDAIASTVTEAEPRVAHRTAVAAAREAISEARAALLAGQTLDNAEVPARALTLANQAGRPSLVPVINATGVILHTNLGRAPLSERAIAAMAAVGRGYSNLEFDLVEGQRGSRHDHARALIAEVTGAEDAIVVNNNAAALYMALHVLASPGEVIVSRGQAVEIGGGFRIPDVVRESGARIVEVGTTNRTYLRDYAAASGEGTRAILRVHSSNFRLSGFTASAGLAELAGLAQERGLLLLDDLGSGALIDTAAYGMTHEPMAQESLAAGADLVLFSGDKLLGGPQCGIIAGRATLIAELRRHPLARALRVDKFTLAALNATLLSYASGRAAEEIPIWKMLSTPLAELKRRARRWAAVYGVNGAVVAARSVVGGGSLPGEGVDSWAAALAPIEGAEQLNRCLRGFEPPIIGRIVEGRVLLDPRTVAPTDDAIVRRALSTAVERQ